MFLTTKSATTSPAVYTLCDFDRSMSEKVSFIISPPHCSERPALLHTWFPTKYPPCHHHIRNPLSSFRFPPFRLCSYSPRLIFLYNTLTHIVYYSLTVSIPSLFSFPLFDVLAWTPTISQHCVFVSLFSCYAT